MQGEFNGQNLDHESECIWLLYSLFCSLTSIGTCSFGKESCSNCIALKDHHECSEYYWHFILMFGFVIDVLEIVVEEGISLEQKGDS